MIFLKIINKMQENSRMIEYRMGQLEFANYLDFIHTP
jgi:hypothetical protein